MERPIVVLGSTGQVGRALLKELGKKGMGLARPDADLTKIEDLLSKLDRIQPGVLINASAYTDVERAESEADLADQVNGRAPGELAAWAKRHGVPFVHYSTDYVFSGQTSRAWKENDPCEPINVYGKSKRHGETAIERSGADYLIFRTSWVYDAAGKNFVNTMLRLGSERESLSVVSDQLGAPTFAKDIAQATLAALESADSKGSFPAGIYHMTAAGETSWWDFAREIFEEARALGFSLKVTDVSGIATEDCPTKVARPKNSRLNNSKFRETFGFALRDWKSALNDCLKERCGHAI